MIDWFRGEIPFQHEPLPSGSLLSITPEGDIEWQSIKRLDCRSSWESNLMLRSVGAAGHGFASGLMIDGNISKFLQGHNVIGSRDLNRLVYLAFEKIYQIYEDHFHGWSNPELTLARIKKGDYLVKMLDINQLYDIGNDASVEAWLHAAEMRARSRHGRSSRDKGTVYLGKSSRRWGIKFYNKFREMQCKAGKKGHDLPLELQDQGLETFVVGKLRAELRIFSKELEKHGLKQGKDFTTKIIDNLFTAYLEKIDMTAQATLIDDQLLKMPRALQATYQLWRQGADLFHLMAPRTFYRHRTELKTYGIDISMPHLSPERNNVIPLIRVIEAKPVPNPQWAYEKGLIAA